MTAFDVSRLMSRLSCASRTLAIVALGLGLAGGAHALEALDGRIQAHGYFEMQMRVLNKNYSDQWDMSQWYNIFNLEMEFDLVQDTHGPLDLLSAYVRLEGRFDCIYSRGCGMIRAIDVYGDRARKMPGRLNRGDIFTSAGQVPISNDGPFANARRDPLRVEQVPGFEGIYDAAEEGLGPVDREPLLQCADVVNGCTEDQTSRFDPTGVPVEFWQADRNKRSGTDGFATDDGTAGSPFLMVMRDFRDFRFTSMPVIGGAANGHATRVMGPWLPQNFVQPNGALANQPNPLDSSRVIPQSLSPGGGSNPMRPIPILREDDPERFAVFIRQTSDDSTDPDKNNILNPHWVALNPASKDVRLWNDRAAEAWEAHGLFMPSPRLKEALQEGKFGSYPFNISQTERAFNHGASQNDEGELKEAYFDAELFDSRLWLRIGKQGIVWGKTELFRTTDQFNPQDFALATLPSLEESRISLWALRGVYSFYEVGPLDDVRVEAAFNFDEFESADLGGCGEPYAVNLVCAITFGSFAHGIAGVGVAGFVQPENPWDDIRGWEIGGRVEFRWSRFSFAFTDFYGYHDFPHPVRLTSYNRNVDWQTGRPRHYMHTEQQMLLRNGGIGTGCATPGGAGLVFADLTQEPTNVGDYVEFTGSGNEGCLYPGPSNRRVGADGAGYRASATAPTNPNKLGPFAGFYANNTSRADPNDLRPHFSTASVASPTSVSDWPEGPNAHFCETLAGLAGHADCASDRRGKRAYDSSYYLTDGVTPNPAYNPFYVSQFDKHFTLDVTTPTHSYVLQPGNEIATTPIRYDPLKATANPNVADSDAAAIWSNSYDPTLVYDSRNSLDLSAVNMSLFAWVCATTVGFSDLDPTACAQTVFGSTRQADNDGPRISFVISSLLAGDPGLNSFLSTSPSDKQLSKGSALPVSMGIPLSQIHYDLSTTDASGGLLGSGLGAFRTTDVRRNWNDVANGTSPFVDSSLWIYTREAESYNCLPGTWDASLLTAPQLCGGLIIAMQRPSVEDRYLASTYVSKGFTPEQEALLGCGPFFGTSCDTNGADLLWAEASALLQSFIGSDSKGISFTDLGIEGLVPASFGDRLTDSGSGGYEYRTDGRVIGSNGQLLRIDPVTNLPALGSGGLLATGSSAGYLGQTECDYSQVGTSGEALVLSAVGAGVATAALQDLNNAGSAINNRWNPRCWDNRRHFVAYAIQPGTAGFEILGLGPPKCTTADIGGLYAEAGMLPGCRNKWSTILYSPTADWNPATGLHPNNPDAGYIGNNYLGQVMSYKSARLDPTGTATPRTDYRQFANGTDLADLTNCGTGTPSAPGDPDDPANFDCYTAGPNAGLPDLGPGGAVRSDNGIWTAQVAASRRSGLNWGVYWEEAQGESVTRPAGCTFDAGDPRARSEPECYYGGWRQTVDGDPDSVGLQPGGMLYPQWTNTTGVPDIYAVAEAGSTVQALAEGTTGVERVENGCTPGRSWVFLQRTSDNTLLGAPECAHVFAGVGAGHIFTGESFASELAAVSYNFMNVLVTFSDDFKDGLGSVAAFVQPWLFESRYIYDEPWMWDESCTVQTCGRVWNSKYGNPNWLLSGTEKYKDSNGAVITRQQGLGFFRPGLHNHAAVNGDTVEQIAARKINPLPDGVENKLQRDPSLPNILDMFPDLLEYECDTFAPGAAHTPENCDSWNKEAQKVRFGDPSDPDKKGLVSSLLWDYAYTGTENSLMALIPYCENLGFSQVHVEAAAFGSQPAAQGADKWGPARVDCTRGMNGETLGRERCTYVTPQFCDLVQALLSIAGQKRNILRAGGNGTFGRRTMQWQSGGEIYLAYEKRNVLGLSMDFAEDFTKTNWGMEFTWIEGVPQVDNNSWDLTSKTNDFNLTLSVDRPTFINFLNANRTFFINSQWFFQYREGYNHGMTTNGPFNVLATLAFFTGYFQDRLNPSMIFVYDFGSVSGAALPQVNYRFSEAFSVTVGASMFMGRQEFVDMPVNGVAPAAPRTGPWAYKDAIEPALSIVRDRDEVFMTLRYTF